MKTFIKHSTKNLPLYLVLLLFTLLFFYRLDYNTLASWDEGWYGAIARTMARTGDFIHMQWNGKPYYDHPAFGFWLMAYSYKLFGINEFTTRLPSALTGVLTLLFIYLTLVFITGKKVIGIVGMLIMGTCVWFVLRVRSGNLDSPFVFFYILTVYCAFRSSRDFRWFPLCAFAFGALCMTKTLIGISALPLIIVLNIHHLKHIRAHSFYLLLGAVLWALVVVPWYYIHYKTYSDFFQYHFLTIGARDKTFLSYFDFHVEKPLFYLHMGIRRWYYLWLVSLVACFAHISHNIFRYGISKKIPKQTLYIASLLFCNLLVLYPFLTSEKTELWHLIPVYLPASCIIAIGMYELFQWGATFISKVAVLKWAKHSFVIVYICIMSIVALSQVKVFYPEVIPAARYTPDEVDICKRIAKYKEKAYLDDDFFPVCVFYSDRLLYGLASFGEIPEVNTMTKLFQTDNTHFVVITRSWAVDNLKVAKIPYKIWEKNNSFTIVSRP